MYALIIPTILLGIIPNPILNMIWESSNLIYKI
jgi:NADH:ubiquinone oxidoreductase subunit 4 (subunit M)